MRRYSLIVTAVYFAVAAAVFFTGLCIWGKKENLLTIFAVLIVLPAVRSLVNMVMYLRFHSPDPEFYARLTEKIDPGTLFFESVLTVERGGAYFVPVMCHSGIVLGVFTDRKSSETVKAHLKNMFDTAMVKGVRIETFDNEKAFLKFAGGVQDKEKREEVFAVVRAVSL